MDLNCFFSIKCPRNFTRVRKKTRDLSGAAFLTMNISSFVCDCIKTSSKYVIAFLLNIRGLKFLLINAENAAGLMEIP